MKQSDLFEHIFHITDPEPDPQAGDILIAKPGMDDNTFTRTVALVIDHHSDKESMALVVNRLAGYSLSRFFPDFPNADRIPIYYGGPVDPKVMFLLHNLDRNIITGGLKLSMGMSLGGNMDDLRRYVELAGTCEGKVKFIMGYSGWSAGQLDMEIQMHSWAVTPFPDPRMILDSNVGSIWSEAVDILGPRYRFWHNWPRNPSAN